MSFDINTLQLNDTATLHLAKPDGSGELLYADEAETLPLEIELYGRASKQYRNWLTRASKKAERESKKNKSADETLQENAKFLAAVTKSVRNIKMGDVEVNTPETIEAMYANAKLLWVGEQVGAKLGEQESFLPS